MRVFLFKEDDELRSRLTTNRVSSENLLRSDAKAVVFPASLAPSHITATELFVDDDMSQV